MHYNSQQASLMMMSTGSHCAIPGDAHKREGSRGAANLARKDNPLTSLMASPLKNGPQIRKSDAIRFIQRLKRLRKFQLRATSARVDLDQISMEVGHSSFDVSRQDARFMSAVQRLLSDVKPELDVREELVGLASHCQAARDRHGPLESEEEDASRTWLAETWRLGEEEDSFLEEFDYLFDEADKCSSATPSTSSLHSEPTSKRIAQILDDQGSNKSQEPVFLPPTSLEISPTPSGGSPTSNYRMNSNADLTTSKPGIYSFIDATEEIFRSEFNKEEDNPTYATSIDLDNGPGQIFLHTSRSMQSATFELPTQPAFPKATSSTNLLADFSTPWDRINRWLLHKCLLSPLDAGILVNLLDTENPDHPSDWAKLVIAWWEVDVEPHGPKLGDPFPIAEYESRARSEANGLNVAPQNARNSASQQSLTQVIGIKPAEGAGAHLFSSKAESRGSLFPIDDPLIAASVVVALLSHHSQMKGLFDGFHEPADLQTFNEEIHQLTEELSLTLAKEAKNHIEEVSAKVVYISRWKIASDIEHAVNKANFTRSKYGQINREETNPYIERSTRESNVMLTQIEAFVLGSHAFREFRIGLEVMLGFEWETRMVPAHSADCDEMNYHELSVSAQWRHSNPRYQVVPEDDMMFFWKVGRVFMMPWTELDNINSFSEDPHPIVVLLNDTRYTKIGRFVVLSVNQSNIICSPINAYSNQATLKPGLAEPHQHAVIYTSATCPPLYSYTTDDGTSLSEDLSKAAIRVISEQPDPDGDLGSRSRLNYSNKYTVDKSARVLNIGMVHPEWLLTLNKIGESPAESPNTNKTGRFEKSGNRYQRKSDRRTW